MLRSGSTLLRRVVVDLNKSHGCRLVDSKGQEYIDLHSNIASLPLGYNHPDFTRCLRDPAVQSLAVHRQATNLYPPQEHEQQLLKVFPKINPMRGGYLHLTSSGSEAIENALKYCTRNEGGPLHALSFRGGFHGRTLGALSVTHTHPEHRSGFPLLYNSVAEFPQCMDDEAKCVQEVERLFIQTPTIACLITEPVQGEGGDRMASPSFFRRIRDLCTRYEKYFVVDEVQTGLGTGRLWAHEHWQLATPPDVVVFSKKFQASGLFMRSSLAPTPGDAYAYNSTWAGDPFRTAMLGVLLDVIDRDGLLSRSTSVGNELFAGLRELPGIRNVRNIGSFGAFDIDYTDYYVQALQRHGLLVSKCGSSSIRIRPPLILEKKDVEEALDILWTVLR